MCYQATAVLCATALVSNWLLTVIPSTSPLFNSLMELSALLLHCFCRFVRPCLTIVWNCPSYSLMCMAHVCVLMWCNVCFCQSLWLFLCIRKSLWWQVNILRSVLNCDCTKNNVLELFHTFPLFQFIFS